MFNYLEEIIIISLLFLLMVMNNAAAEGFCRRLLPKAFAEGYNSLFKGNPAVRPGSDDKIKIYS